MAQVQHVPREVLLFVYLSVEKISFPPTASDRNSWASFIKYRSRVWYSSQRSVSRMLGGALHDALPRQDSTNQISTLVDADETKAQRISIEFSLS